jgi:hypothetical protein
MLRAAFESIGLFLLPFLVFAGYLALRLRYPLEIAHWTHSRVARMTLIGLSLALAGLIALGLTQQRGKGVYVPAHVENGVLIPGHIE